MYNNIIIIIIIFNNIVLSVLHSSLILHNTHVSPFQKLKKENSMVAINIIA